ncbi:hypothetical protein TEHN7126_2217 [Tetragenococcus halophilus subsp. halophilus]|uniref:hypothetical protein n=1 Tax=Tetragenococcus halophilus TaxID=51669 RepID=UPI000CB419AB|nr:hypothetical protein [Tetragenococcus halophilus]GBD74240.1 hypothetical protein TEHN7125_2400 [Tetragenococcus halophilus subsp. halophilus]GBD76518.1 hypothetical protein TEHN7126_2217 [Tetragenococcus halophilus subsp. halophilus]
MFTWEDGAKEIIEKSMQQYEEELEDEFPLFAYIKTTENDEYDFSLKGALRLQELINDLIEKEEFAEKPPDYDERIY